MDVILKGLISEENILSTIIHKKGKKVNYIYVNWYFYISNYEIEIKNFIYQVDISSQMLETFHSNVINSN